MAKALSVDLRRRVIDALVEVMTRVSVGSVVVCRPVLVGNVAIFHRRFEHHALIELIDHAALDFLPRRLAFRHIGKTAIGEFRSDLGAPAFQFLIGNKDIGLARIQIDPHRVAGF